MPKPTAALCLLALVLVSLGALPHARAEQPAPLQVLEARPLLRELPDATIHLAGGKTAQLSELWAEKPLLLTFFYQRCAGSCSPFLRSLRAAVTRAGGLGEDYRVVSLSFDPQDTPERVAQLAEILEINIPDQWLVATSSPHDIEALAQSAGFWWEPVAGTGQFDHPAMVIAVRDGRIVRVLLGNTVSHPRFREMLADLQGRYLPFYINPEVDTPFRCLDVDLETGELKLGWGMLMILVPGLLTLAGVLLIFARRPRLHAE